MNLAFTRKTVILDTISHCPVMERTSDNAVEFEETFKLLEDRWPGEFIKYQYHVHSTLESLIESRASFDKLPTSEKYARIPLGVPLPNNSHK